MADVKISALPAVAAAATTDIFAIVQGGVTYKATLTQVIAAIPDATGSVRGLLTSTDWTTFNSKQSALTFSTGLTNAAGTVTSNLSTGVAGGQSVIGGTAASNSLTLSSTTNATKGKILFGTSAYDEVNNRLGIGTASPTQALDVRGQINLITPSAVSTRETLMIAKVSDNTDDQFGIANGTINDTRFIPSFYGFGNGTYSQLQFRTLTTAANDSGTISMMTFLAARTNSTTDPNNGTLTAIVTRPLFAWVNESTFLMQIVANGNVLINTTTDAGYRLDVNGTERVQGRLTVSQDTTVATQTSAVITTDTANCSLVLRPTGTGAIIANAPDGTATGGNARGTYAVDLQTSRASNLQVASGQYSTIIGGYANRSTSDYTISGGYACQATANSAVSFGNENQATYAFSSISGGAYARTFMYGQRANASGFFVTHSDSQTSAITYRRSITGQSALELFLNGSSERAVLSLSSGPTNGRAWRAQVDVVAIVQTVGNGTVTLGDCFMGSYHVGIKNIGGTTSLVGTVSITNEVNDAGMAGAAVTITADNTNDSLKIEFTPATAAGTTTVTRVVATAYLTEVGY